VPIEGEFFGNSLLCASGLRRIANLHSLGLGLTKIYAKRPNYTIIAACRTPSSMPEVQTAEGSKIIVVKLDTSKNEDSKAVSLLYFISLKAD